MVFEIGELDKASQGPVWAGFVGDAFHIGAVVVVFIACKEHKRTELDRAQSLGAQLAEGEVRTFEDVVQQRSSARVLWHRGCDALDVIEQRPAGGGLLALVSGLGDRAGSALSHCVPQPCLPVDVALCMVCSDCFVGHESAMATTVPCPGFAATHLRRFCRISLADRGAGRVDGAQADQADRLRDGVGGARRS